jgi:hypothetical protein
MYEEYEEDNISGGLPFIQVPAEREMPDIIFMFGSTETGEFEPDLEGNPEPIMEMELYQYANMQYLKEDLDEETYDKVRIALGLEPLSIATQKGMKQSEKILNKETE